MSPVTQGRFTVEVKELRLRWFGWRRDAGYVGNGLLKMELPFRPEGVVYQMNSPGYPAPRQSEGVKVEIVGTSEKRCW